MCAACRQGLACCAGSVITTHGRTVSDILPALSCPAEAVGIDPTAAAEASPKPTAETIDSNRLPDEEGKNIPDVFLRKETVSRAAVTAAGSMHCSHSCSRAPGPGSERVRLAQHPDAVTHSVSCGITWQLMT